MNQPSSSRSSNDKAADFRAGPPAPDLNSQFEELLHQVWSAEAEWRFDDRLDLAVKYRRPARPKLG
ncbi:MAG: hypothetical protein ACR2MZ_14440 [Candidatus Dormibacter sp.]|uniref:hypothetical protein n=1 Tax=Candidatus Dormibacter sp. TaxID=2973982 RepID=UPI003D9AFECD